MKKLFCFIAIIAFVNSSIQCFAQRGGCPDDVVPPTATIITTETTESTPLKSWYVCIGPLHYMDDGINAEGLDTFYVDQQGTLDLQKCAECRVKALAPATVMLYSNGGALLELKCDSGVSVSLNGAPMVPYTCTCNPFIFINAPASCPVGVEKLFSESSDVNVYPNPATETLTVHWKNIPSGDIYFEMYSVTLNKVMSGVFKTGTDIGVLPITSLQSGFYFLQLNSDAGTETKSFIKL